jgi:predicted dehydrogenase
MADYTCREEFSLHEAPPLRWGVAAPGGIAADFVRTVKRHTNQRIDAVASRSLTRAHDFGDRFDIPNRYGSYAELADSDVDVVYVAAVNSAHSDIALTAIEAGKHVLIEKPLAPSALEVRRIAEAAVGAGVLVMEGMWTRYVPSYTELARQLDEGMIGEAQTATANVGWRADPDPGSHLWDPRLGGGVTLDMGVYGLWFAQFSLGRPTNVTAVGRMIGEIDDQVAVILQTDDGRLATVTSTMAGTMSGHAEIVGTSAVAEMTDHLVFPTGFTTTSASGRREWRDESGLVGRAGLAWEAAALATYVAEGRLDSPLHSLGDAMSLAETMDSVRAQLRKAAADRAPGDVPAGGRL